MKNSQLDNMSVKELVDLKAQIDDIIPQKEKEAVSELREKMQAMAREAGTSVSDLFGKSKANGRRKSGKVAPKYRNPKNPDETWTGRGRRPRWMTAAGGDPKRFLIA